MKRFLVALFFLHVNLVANTLSVNNFKANVFSKTDKKPVEATLSLILEGKDVDVYERKVVDALNVVIGSYFAEDLITSKGKELLKATLIAYAKKTHNLTIDIVYIKDLVIKINPSVQEIVDALKKEGLFNPAPKQQPQQQLQQLLPSLAPPPSRKLPLPDDSSVNF